MLNNEQLNAVNHRNGPALIYAGPGSGKTTVITHHIKFLIDIVGVNPKNILVISFSKASALELKNRYKSLDNLNYNEISFGTFHSVYLKILKLYNASNCDIVSEEQKNKIVATICNNSDLAEKFKTVVSYYKSYINKNCVFIDDLSIKLIEEYNDLLSCNNLMDFDDILIKCYELIYNNKYVRDELLSMFSAILIDEFQDINEYQYETVKLISDNNLYVVGDENQSIYSFRGAKADIMNTFLNDYSNASVYNLNTNYRCHYDIINASNTVIQHNTISHKNEIVAFNKQDGNHFEIKVCKSMEDECREIREILKCHSLKSIAILLRTNKDVEQYYAITDSKDYKFENIKKHILKILFYYLDASFYNSQDSLLHILNIPNRFIPRNFVINNIDNEYKANKNIFFSGELTKLYNHLKTIKCSSPQTFVLYLKNIIKLDLYFESYYSDINKNNINEIFLEILKESEEFNNLIDYYKYLNKFQKDNEKKNHENKNIKIMTFHASKGLEFDIVIIPDLIEGVIPGRISIGNMNVEEERRLFYVAMTRAKDKLYLMTLQDENSMKYTPSRFLDGLMK